MHVYFVNFSRIDGSLSMSLGANLLCRPLRMNEFIYIIYTFFAQCTRISMPKFTLFEKLYSHAIRKL